MRDVKEEGAVVPFPEAAQIAEFHPMTLERAIDRGELHPLRRGPAKRAPRYLRRDEVLKWAQERRRLRSDE